MFCWIKIFFKFLITLERLFASARLLSEALLQSKLSNLSWVAIVAHNSHWVPRTAGPATTAPQDGTLCTWTVLSEYTVVFFDGNGIYFESDTLLEKRQINLHRSGDALWLRTSSPWWVKRGKITPGGKPPRYSLPYSLIFRICEGCGDFISAQDT